MNYAWVLDEIWMNSEWVLTEFCMFWMSYERIIRKFWMDSERVPSELWMDYISILDRFWTSLNWVMHEFWINSKWILYVFWMDSEWVLNGFCMNSLAFLIKLLGCFAGIIMSLDWKLHAYVEHTTNDFWAKSTYWTSVRIFWVGGPHIATYKTSLQLIRRFEEGRRRHIEP